MNIWKVAGVALLLGMAGSASAQRCGFDILYAKQRFAGQNENLKEKYLDFNTLKGSQYPNPILMVQLKPSAGSENFAERIWFEKGKCYYLLYKVESGLSYLLYNTDFPNEGLNILVPSGVNNANGMVQFVHFMNGEPLLDTAVYITPAEARELENFLKEQLKNLDFDNKGYL